MAGLAKVGPGLGDFRLPSLTGIKGSMMGFNQKKKHLNEAGCYFLQRDLDHHQKCLCQSCLGFVPKHQGRENYGVFPLKGKLLNVRALTLDGRTLNAPSWEGKRKNMHVKV